MLWQSLRAKRVSKMAKKSTEKESLAVESGFLIPDLKDGAIHRTELIVKKSRFITSIGHCKGTDECKSFVQRIATEFSDARHNCFAFCGGRPGDTGHAGCSDDGEPSGTAGKPMLTVLLHCGAGEICCVVTRYFGGILLGTGGLVKAYQDSVKQSLETLKLTPMILMKTVHAEISPRFITLMQRLLAEVGGKIKDSFFSDKAVYELNIPEKHADFFCQKLQSTCSGGAVIKVLD